MDTDTLILASNSPRRRALLEQVGIKFRVEVSDIDETIPAGMTPRQAVAMLAEKKAAEVARRCDDEALILAADTVVAYDGMILGKPEHESDMFQMLTMLSGNWHKVYTGLCLRRGGKQVTQVVRTRVKFSELSEEEIEAYIRTGEPGDKAGGYAIQGAGAVFVEEIEGDYYNVVGLPLNTLYRLLKTEFHFRPFSED